MEAQQQKKPEAGGDGADVEDIPSDFFDDFNKADFIEGLSVIDSWDDKLGRNNDRPRFNTEVVDKVKDLRELMSDGKQKREGSGDKRNCSKNEPLRRRRSSSNSRLDEFIKPGSRRDPNKTNEAIKRDKEEKVKEFLAKTLESADDLRPPGTELDDYFEAKTSEKRVPMSFDPKSRSRSRPRYEMEQFPQKPRSRSRERRRDSPRKFQQWRNSMWSPRKSPMRRRISRSPRRSPRRNNLWHPNSPFRQPMGFNKRFKFYSPMRERRMSPRRSPRRHSPRRSPRHSPRRSPHRSPHHSPFHSPRYTRRSRSRSAYRRPRRSRSPSNRDSFLYPLEPELPTNFGPPGQYQATRQFDLPTEYPGPSGPPQGYPSYRDSGCRGYNAPYEYSGQPVSQPLPPAIIPPPVPAPNTMPNHSVHPPNPIPTMVPAPSMVPSTPPIKQDVRTPYDALAKLVAEGKISQEDYLKLAPNKGTLSVSNDKNRVMVLNRCSSALIKLKTLDLPNQLLLNHDIRPSEEPKYIAPKFCSPLKRQASVQFQFTIVNGPSIAQQNKHLIDSIIAAVGLEKVVSRPKKKDLKNTRDAACQTSKPFCDVCEIRAATKTEVGSTSIDREYFYSSVHTQVVEQELISSKSIFNPSGSVGDGAPMSIAHLTPAQLVSQLAARAKTLKNSDSVSNQYRRNQDYDYRSNPNQQYQNYNNYRY